MIHLFSNSFPLELLIRVIPIKDTPPQTFEDIQGDVKNKKNPQNKFYIEIS